MTNEERLKAKEKEIMKLSTINAVPSIMLGLGLHAKFGIGGDKLVFEFLKNESIVNGMLLVSIPVFLWVMFRGFKLVIEKKRLKNNINL